VGRGTGSDPDRRVAPGRQPGQIEARSGRKAETGQTGEEIVRAVTDHRVGRGRRATAAHVRLASGATTSRPMVVHIVLFRPKASLGGIEQKALLASIEHAAASIPSVRRFRIGKTVANPPSYQLQGFPDLPYLAVVEFDDRAGLEEYLEHQLHGDLGRRFNDSLEAALIYDYELADAADARQLIR
jgi:hypothetical protein